MRQRNKSPDFRADPTAGPVRDSGYLPDFTSWRTGDLLLFSTIAPTWVQSRIIATQRRLQYGPEDARWHHAAVYIGDQYLCEARPGGVRCHPVAEMVGPNLIGVRRDNNLQPQARFRVAIRALMRLSQPYRYGAAGREWLRSLRRGRSVFDHRARERAMVCSQLFHDAYQETTSRSLVQRVDTLVTPAELSACSGLSDVEVAWAALR